MTSDFCLLSHHGTALEQSFTFTFQTPKKAEDFLLLCGMR